MLPIQKLLIDIVSAMIGCLSTDCKIVKKHWGDKIDTESQIVYPHYANEITNLSVIRMT